MRCAFITNFLHGHGQNHTSHSRGAFYPLRFFPNFWACGNFTDVGLICTGPSSRGLLFLIWLPAPLDPASKAEARIVDPERNRGPWRIICDSESFLFAEDRAKVHKKIFVRFIMIPAKPPDLNPVERFWSWARRALTQMDFDDLVKGRPVPGRTA